MKSPQSRPPSHAALQSKTLKKVLSQSEHVQDLVAQSAEDLAFVNSSLKVEVTFLDPLSEIAKVVEKSEAVEDKVQEAADNLTVVNQALKAEVHVRQALEQQLAAVTQDEETARHAALHDPLTGLPNRMLFNDRLEHGLAQASRHGQSLAVMFMDLDDFKQVNDTHGHDAGDAVLRTVAERLLENTRGDDTVSRHGGDEFLYLLMETGDARDIQHLAEKILRAVQAPCANGESALVVKLSIGIAIFPKDGSTASALIKSADEAMYAAKRSQSGYAFFG